MIKEYGGVQYRVPKVGEVLTLKSREELALQNKTNRTYGANDEMMSMTGKKLTVSRLSDNYNAGVLMRMKEMGYNWHPLMFEETSKVVDPYISLMID